MKAGQTFHQGSADMLCGIYCAAHLIACFKVKNNQPRSQQAFYEDAAGEAFHKLMKSVEELKMLTATRLCEGEPNKGGGFNDKELERIFNRLSEKDREGLRAVAFCRATVTRLRGSQKRKFLDHGARVIFNESGENHWITAEGRHRDGGYCSFDPSLDESSGRVPLIRWAKGLFVGEPTFFEYIYAQTH